MFKITVIFNESDERKDITGIVEQKIENGIMVIKLPFALNNLRNIFVESGVYSNGDVPEYKSIRVVAPKEQKEKIFRIPDLVKKVKKILNYAFFVACLISVFFYGVISTVPNTAEYSFGDWLNLVWLAIVLNGILFRWKI